MSWCDDVGNAAGVVFAGDEQYSATTASDWRGDKNTTEPKREQTGAPSAASYNGQFCLKQSI